MLPRSVSTGSLLDDAGDEDAVANLASYTALRPEASSARSTVESTEESTDIGPAKIPDWDGIFWKRYGNKSRVGPFGLVLCTGKYAEDHVS